MNSDRRRMCGGLLATGVFCANGTIPMFAPGGARVAELVKRVRRADYEGDLAALRHLFGKLAAFVEDGAHADKVRYWRGFALWRRAINGFNEKIDRAELQRDMQTATEEFEAALKKSPSFLDAGIALLGSIGGLLFLDRKSGTTMEFNDPQRAKTLIDRAMAVAKEARATDPNHPRLLWVLGPNVYASPPERGGPDKAIELYLKGLDTIRAGKRKPGESDPLMPDWGEPELLMSLAWTNLNRTNPDLGAAERYAREALALVPYWHYVRDILLPQIAAAKSGRK